MQAFSVGGGHMMGTLTEGTWLAEETRLHIDILELRAIRLTLQRFGHNFQNQHVLIQTDNVIAKAFINRWGAPEQGP